MAALSFYAPAKLNLYLHILARRADGYHALESLVAFTSLADELRFEHADALTLNVTGEFSPEAGAGDDNLVLKAARALQAATGYAGGAAIALTKNIPVGAGLGGGSADCAAALRGLNLLWELGLSDDALHALAVKLGADVAMCLASKPAIARGIGEQLEFLPALPPLHAVLAYPRVPLLTAEIYGRYVPQAARPTPLLDYSDTHALLVSLQPTRNDLQRAAIELRPEVAELLLALETLALPSPLVRMTGSGACCFALYDNVSDAESAASTLRHEYPNWFIKPVALI